MSQHELTHIIAAPSKPTDYAYPKYTTDDKKAALVAALRYLKIEEHVNPSFMSLLESLDLVDVEASQFLCCGTCESEGKKGARCRMRVQKDEVARTIQSLQTLALDNSYIDSNQLQTSLDNKAIHLLCKNYHQKDGQAYVLGDKLYAAFKQFRAKTSPPNKQEEQGPKISQAAYDKVVQERDEAKKGIEALQNKLAALKVENQLLKHGLVPTPKVRICGHQKTFSTPSSSNKDTTKSKVQQGFSFVGKSEPQVKQEPGIDTPPSTPSSSGKDTTKSKHRLASLSV